MLLVKTKVGQSTVHGLGLFADEFIAKGAPTWKYESWFDHSYTEEDIKKMSEPARKQIMWYAYYDKGGDKYILPADDLRFINHSASRANIQSTPYTDVAMRDIQPGEELLCDYHQFDDTYFDRMGMPKDTLSH